MATKTMVTSDQTLGAPVILIEGEAVAFQIDVPNVVTGITGTPLLSMYRQNSGADIAATYFVSANCTVSGNSIVTAATQNLKAGDWVVNIKAVVDGNTRMVYRFPLLVKRANQV
jgi:hypothetical protein